MDIESSAGTRVRFLNENGHDGQRTAAKVLSTTEIYTVSHIEIYSWHSTVFLEGVQGGFNTVMFENVDDEYETENHFTDTFYGIHAHADS